MALSEWVLIIVVISYKGGITIDHVPFHDESSCRAAMTRVVDNVKDMRFASGRTICLRTGGVES